MSRSIPASAYVEHFEPELAHHRAWLLAVLERLVTQDPQALEEGGTLRRLWTEHQQSASAAGTQTSQTAPLQTKPQPSAAKASVADIPGAVLVAMPLVKKFEGCRLSACPDPETGAEPWTIGWGTTTYYDGTPVKAGDTISQELADALLAGRLERDWGLLKKLVPGWPQFSVNHITTNLIRNQMLEVVIRGEKKSVGCSRAGCDPKIVLAHMPSTLGVFSGVEINAHISIDHQRMMDVNNHQALECSLQCLAFPLPPVVHLCKDANLSQADNTDQRSWLAVDQVVQTENPLANFCAPYQVNDHAGIE